LKETKNKSKYTDAIHAGQHPDPVFGGINVPIYQSSTFVFKNAKQGAARFAGEEDGYIYTRLGNPTIKALEDNVAVLENGYGSLATSSGMSALSTLVMAFMDSNSHMISTAALYGSSRTLVEELFSKFGVEYDYVDTSDINNIKKCLKPNTKALFVETPANPTMVLTDIRACAQLAKENGLTLVVDNTFASPILQNPLDLGADIVYHSVTKFINGHADVVGGIIVAKTQDLFDQIKKTLVLSGATMDPNQAWLVLRGVKSLALRVEKAQDNAIKIAGFLENHPKVAWVNYPGLKSHPQHDLAKNQMKGFGSLLCFGMKSGFKAGQKLINTINIPALAVSLGGIESLIQHPASMTHASVSRENREKAGITDELIRLSVGCEGFDDLKNDLEETLSKID
jgi:methionine-gamma-lyase